jgi:hypothetical protein
MTRRGCALPESSSRITCCTSFHVDTMQNTMSRDASSGSAAATFAPSFASGSALARVRFQTRTSAPPLARRAAIS